MANTNTGSPVRWENGGILRVVIDPDGTPADNELLLVEAGTINFQPGLTEGIVIMDRGQLTGVKSGDERPSTVSFTLKIGKTTFDTLLDLMTPTDSGGDKVLFDIEIEFTDGTGGTVDEGVRFQDCWMPDGYQYQTGSGGAVDTVSFTLNSLSHEPDYYDPSA